ncbi:22179_t:CDS:2, partial [Dentiscutata erythropus]
MSSQETFIEITPQDMYLDSRKFQENLNDGKYPLEVTVSFTYCGYNYILERRSAYIILKILPRYKRFCDAEITINVLDLTGQHKPTKKMFKINQTLRGDLKKEFKTAVLSVVYIKGLIYVDRNFRSSLDMFNSSKMSDEHNILIENKTVIEEQGLNHPKKKLERGFFNFFKQAYG